MGKNDKKTVLFVDDRPETMANFMDVLNTKGIDAQWVETLDDAVKFIQTHSETLAGVIIDLHMPGISKIDTYQKNYKVTINNGQSLGLFIRDKFRQIPYFYFSNVAESYNKPKSLKENETENIESKYDIDIDEFPELCKKMFEV